MGDRRSLKINYHMWSGWCVSLFVVVASSLLFAASQRHEVNAFDVAAVRRNLSGSTNSGARQMPGGRFVVTNQTLRELVWTAYDVPPNRIIGGPGWMDEERYDIEAKAPDDASSNAPIEAMLQSLLRERFALRVRQESREYPVFFLIRLRKDRLGPRLRVSTECATSTVSSRSNESNTRATCGIRMAPGRLLGGGMTIASLADGLAGATGRSVFDRTELSGKFDVDLEWRSLTALDDANERVSIFTAVQEQLGLKLESGRANLPVIVIDGVERPTEN